MEAPQTKEIVQRFSRARTDPALAVLEGFHTLKHALRFDAKVDLVVTTDKAALEQLATKLAPDLVDRFSELASTVTPSVMGKLVTQVPPTGVLAIAHRNEHTASEVFLSPSPEPVVLLEDPRNLGNLGAVVRVAAAADVAGVVTTGMHDPWDPTALRGSAGLHYALPVAHALQLKLHERPLLAVHPEGEPVKPGAIPQRAVLAFGTERHGLSEALLTQADRCLSIPMRKGVSSLNLATSVAAVLFSQKLHLD